jgi:integrase/recombinase XerD
MSHLAGLRAKEIADLSIKDVLAEDGAIKDQIYLRPAQTKGSRGRTVLLPEKLRAELQDYICARFRLQVKDLHVIHYTDTSRALFYSQKSAVRGFSPNTLAQWFGTLYSSVGISGASSHSGRRFFATHLADNAVNPKVIQSLLGHRQIQTTLLYCSVSPKAMRAAVELLS